MHRAPLPPLPLPRHALQDSQAHRFASDRSMRRRDSQPGYEVGQTLITCRWVLGCGGGAGGWLLLRVEGM